MDALRKSLSGADAGAGKRVPKKPVASVKAEPKKGMGLVKGAAKSSKRKSARGSALSVDSVSRLP